MVAGRCSQFLSVPAGPELRETLSPEYLFPEQNASLSRVPLQSFFHRVRILHAPSSIPQNRKLAGVVPVRRIRVRIHRDRNPQRLRPTSCCGRRNSVPCEPGSVTYDEIVLDSSLPDHCWLRARTNGVILDRRISGHGCVGDCAATGYHASDTQACPVVTQVELSLFLVHLGDLRFAFA